MKLKQTLLANSIVLQLKCLIQFVECAQDLIRLFAVFPIFPTNQKIWQINRYINMQFIDFHCLSTCFRS